MAVLYNLINTSCFEKVHAVPMEVVVAAAVEVAAVNEELMRGLRVVVAVKKPQSYLGGWVEMQIVPMNTNKQICLL